MINSMNTKEFNLKIQKLIEDIKRDAVVFANDTKIDQRLRLQKSESDFFYFAKTYFPHYIKAPFGAPHRKMHSATETDGQVTAIAGFRGLGKTALMSIIKPIWKALHGKIHFNCKIARSKELAQERTESIRIEFLFNQRLKHDFGQQLILGGGEGFDFTIKAGCRFLALGYKSGIRGKIHGSFRPDYIDVDDLEDHNSLNERIAKDKLKFVLEEAFGALYKGKGHIIWLGNLTHQKSALNLYRKLCQDDPTPWRKFLLLPADDGNFNPAWKENFTKSDLLKIYKVMGRIGYERQMRMNPIIEGEIFKAAWLKYGIHSGPKTVVTYCDPSLGNSKSSDYKAIITLGYQAPKYYLLDCWIRKATINDMIHKLYAVNEEFKNTRLYMESNFWQKILWEFIPDIAKDKGYSLPVTGIDNKQNKVLRIEKLQPLFEWGWIVFPSDMNEDVLILQDQLLAFPNYPHDDGPDALAGAIDMIRNRAMQSARDYVSIAKKEFDSNFNKL
jgi:phage uncharacterized protein (putative large terminase), C-terminal domain